MLVKEILLEAGDSGDILKSFFSLAKGDGKFKSEKQKNFLLSKCNAGEGLFILKDTLRFGEHGGASANVEWRVKCDDIGVQQIIKHTGKKGDVVYWERTPEQMAKQNAKAKLHQEELVRHYEDYIPGVLNGIKDLEAELDETLITLNNISDPEKYAKLVAHMGAEDADEIIKDYNKRAESQRAIIDVRREELAKYEAEYRAAKDKLATF